MSPEKIGTLFLSINPNYTDYTFNIVQFQLSSYQTIFMLYRH